MAILLVKIKNKETIPLNEFFDYNGKCYALSRDRDDKVNSTIEMEDFFEASVKTTELHDITVVFTTDEETANIIGWYKAANIYRDVLQPSLFLEGNIVAKSMDVVLLPPQNRNKAIKWQTDTKNYEIIEREDRRYQDIWLFVSKYSGENAFKRYPFVDAKMIPSAIKSVEACNEACEYYASRILNNTCQGISEIKLLEKYGQKLTEMAPKSADGFYYLAMAQCQLGFAKKAIKNIEKAIKLEPTAADLQAQKGIILCSMDYNEAGAECFEKAFIDSHDESYLLLEGMASIRNQDINKGYEIFKKIEDSQILRDAGIELEELDSKNPFYGLAKLFWKIR